MNKDFHEKNKNIRWTDDEFRKKFSESVKNGMNKPGIKEKLKKKSLELWSDPKWRERQEKIFASPEYKEKLRRQMIKRWKNPEYRKRISMSVKITKSVPERNYWFRKTFSDEHKNKISNALKGRKISEEARRKISLKNRVIIKKLWEDENYAKMITKAQHRKPTKPEMFLTNFLNENYPNEWKYVGDGKFFINGKNPDFINQNKKLLLEFNGLYWHQNHQKDVDRAVIFAENGFKTLFVYYEDLENLNSLKEKIDFFSSESIFNT